MRKSFRNEIEPTSSDGNVKNVACKLSGNGHKFGFLFSWGLGEKKK
jgi:hypothetical protein